MVQYSRRHQAMLRAMGVQLFVDKHQVLTEQSVDEEMMPVKTHAASVQADAPPVFVSEQSETRDADLGKSYRFDLFNMTELAAHAQKCRQCALAQTRHNVVFGDGNESADWMFIGEAPGQQEDIAGLPFVGKAGQLLDNMLFALGFSRQQIYIANTVKCRPPNNRDPEPSERQACNGYLLRQIELVAPKVIVALGRVSAQTLIQTELSLGKLRGKAHRIDAINVPIVVTYHPAYLLRRPIDKRLAWQDLNFARALIG